MATSGITHEEIVGWGGMDVFRQAMSICNSGDVKDVRYDDETLVISGKIDRHSGWDMPVSLTLKEKGRIESHCPCYENQKLGQVCPHVVALGIALMAMEADDAARVERERSAAGDDGDGDGRDAPGDDSDVYEKPMVPGFYLTVYGSTRSLSVTVDAWYGDIDFPACSVQSERTVWLKDPDDPEARLVRSMDAEQAALKLLERWGFERGYRENDMRLYLADGMKTLSFLGAGIPEFRRRTGWKVELSPNLEKTVDGMPCVLPLVRIRDVPGGAFDVRYTFEARGREIGAAEIQAALNRNDGFIMCDGTPVLLDNRAIETMHGVFRDCATSQDGAPPGWFRVRSVHAPYVKSSLDALSDAIETEDGEAAEWRRIASVRNRESNAKFEPVALGRLDAVLRPYQKQGVYWMRFLEEAGLSGLLADEMGLGKTLQTLAWLSLPPSGGEAHLPDLIVCPTSLVRNWEAEAAKFTPWLKTLVVSGPDRADVFGEIDGADIVVTSYALLQRDFEEAYLGREFGAIVLDEAQHIKNRQTKNAKSVKLLRSRRRLVLTGTPVENSVADVWSIFDFLMPDYLGDYETFKLRYEQPVAEGGAGAETVLARLKRKLHPFIMRRVKKLVAKDLPDKIVKVSYCPMDEDSQREYLALLAKTRREAGAMVKAKGFAASKFALLGLLMKLRQIASVGKLAAFMEQLVSAVEGGHKILVFSQFVGTLRIIAAQLQEEGIRFCYLDGSTKDRLGECNRFNRDPGIPVFLISLMAGGTGLNLTGADMVMHYDPWWNPAVEAQATDRAHRIGQKKTVYVIKMIASGSIEEKVLDLQRRKQAVIAATVATTDAQVMERLTADDLAELLS